MAQQFADRIRMARRRTGLSQSQVAQALGVHRGTVGHWERGAGHVPTNAHQMQLAVLMAVAYEWLTTGRGSIQLSSNDVPAARLDCFAQSDEEEQLLLAVRKLPEHKRKAILDLARSGASHAFSHAPKLASAAPHLHGEPELHAIRPEKTRVGHPGLAASIG